jgi:UDP-2-acetamido-2,6-beta-L-arabino-hexul-4-ose reductase
MDVDIQTLKSVSDKRGTLIEFLRWTELSSKHASGQIYCVSIQPGCKRGHHYHKQTNEWLTVLHGKVKITLEDVKTGERMVIVLDADSNEGVKRVKYGPNIAHLLENISQSTSVVVVYISEEYNNEDPDNISFSID